MHESPAPAPPEAEDDPIVFSPVPLQRTNHHGWTPRRQHDFIQALAAIGTVRRAAKAVGMTPQSAYKLRERPGAESFAEAWDLALEMGYEQHYSEALNRVRNGVVTPRFYKGKQVGTVHRYDHRLAMTVLDPKPAPARKETPRNKVTRSGGLS